MTVFVSGPMSGVPEFNYPAFAAAAAELRAKGFEVVSPHELHGGHTQQPYVYYMRRDLQALLQCDEVVFLPGWRNSRGACVEHAIAEVLEMPMRDWGGQ